MSISPSSFLLKLLIRSDKIGIIKRKLTSRNFSKGECMIHFSHLMCQVLFFVLISEHDVMNCYDYLKTPRFTCLWKTFFWLGVLGNCMMCSSSGTCVGVMRPHETCRYCPIYVLIHWNLEIQQAPTFVFHIPPFTLTMGCWWGLVGFLFLQQSFIARCKGARHAQQLKTVLSVLLPGWPRWGKWPWHLLLKMYHWHQKRDGFSSLPFCF